MSVVQDIYKERKGGSRFSDDGRLSSIMASAGEDAEAVDLMVKKLGERRFRELQEQMGAIAHRFKKRAERHAERAIT